MGIAEILYQLHEDGLDVTEYMIRCALRSGRLSRPPMDRSNRFVFDQGHLDRLRELFANKATGRVVKSEADKKKGTASKRRRSK